MLELENTVATLVERVAWLSRDREQTVQKNREDRTLRWTVIAAIVGAVVAAIIGAVVGSVATFLLQQYAAIRFPQPK